MSQKLFLKVNIALAGASVEDAYRVLNDCLAFCVGQISEDLKEADRRIDLTTGDLKAAVRRYWPEIQEAQAVRREKPGG